MVKEILKELFIRDLGKLKQEIEAYEIHMRIRAAETGELTLQSTAALHSPGATKFMLSVMG